MNVAALKPYAISNESLLWWGQALMCVIEGTMFLILIAMYFYFRLSVDVWPPPGTRPLNVWLPTLGLIPLLASAVGSYRASRAAERNHRRGMIVGLAVNLALGALFVAFRFAEVRTFTFTWSSDVRGSIVWSILFLHTLDVVADLLMTTVLIVILVRGRVGERQRIGVHVDSVVWYFLVAIWIPLYVVVYWGGRLVGNGG